MANPQCERGFTRLANELYDVGMAELGAVEWKIFSGIVRMSYGYNRKYAEISGARLAEICGMSERQVWKALARLVARGVLYVQRNGPKPMTVRIEKDYELWKERSAENRRTTKRSAEKRRTSPAENLRTKALYHYNEKQKKKTVPRTPSEEALKVARIYHERIRTLYPALTKNMTEKTDNEGALVLDDLVNIDGQEWEDVKKVLRWAMADSFWSKNLRSLAGARKKVSGSGGATKFENCMAKMMEVSEMVRGALPTRPITVTRTWPEGEEPKLPHYLEALFKNTPDGKDAGKIGQKINKTG